MSRLQSLTFLGLVMGLATVAAAADPISWIPGDVNAIARVNVADAYKTPLAKKEGWQKQAAESFVQQDSVIPPGTKQIIIGAALELSDHLVANQKYAVLVPEAQLTLEKLSNWLSSGLEEISGKQAAQFGEDGLIVDAGDGSWLASHGSRQSMSRWLQRGPSSGMTHLSPYLQSALKAKVNTAPVMLAVDLQDNFSKDKIAAQLKATDWFPSESAADTVAGVLASAYGITINVTFDNERVGQVALDFGKDAAPLKPVLEKLVVAILERLGASNDEFTEWKWTIKGSRVTGTGPISPGGVRRMLSVLDPPSVMHAISSASSSTATTEEDRVAKTSQKYCKSIQVLLSDLRSTLTKTRDNHALYFERYGRKLDDLPRLHVDPDLLDFSAKVSSSMRYQGQAQRMANIRSSTRQLEAGVNYNHTGAYGYVGPYGGYGVGVYSTGTNQQGAAAINAEEQQGARDIRFSEWKQIEDGLSAIRTAMTEKYQIEF